MAYPVKRDEVKELRDRIKLHPTGAYFFWGEEEYLKRYYLDELRQVIKDEGMEEFNRTVLDFQRDATFKDLEDAVDALPVMAEHRIVEVWGLDILGLKKDSENRLLDAVKSLASDTILVLYFRDSELDLTIKRNMSKKIISDLKESLVFTEFPRQSEMKLTSWTDRIFKSAEVHISDFNIVKMIKLCDFSMTRLKSESEKLIAYCKQNSTDTVPNEIIEVLVKPTGENAIYEFSDALIRRSKKEAIAILENLKSQNIDSVMVLATISKTLNALALIKSARGKLSSKELHDLTELSEKQIPFYQRALTNWSSADIKNAIHLTFICDRDLKNSSTPPFILVERLVAVIL